MAIDKDMHVLIVDDHHTMRRTLADILRAVDMRNVGYAEDGQQAWDKLNEETEHPFGLVLLDWDMPVMSGIDLLRMIRNSEQFADLPVIMVTAEADQDNVVEAVSGGVSHYIVKPYTPNTVYEKIQQVLGDSF